MRDLRARHAKLKPGTRMMLNIDDARQLTDLTGNPMYRGRNATYVTISSFHADKWLTQAEEALSEEIARALG